ncbi:MAG: hypothetical protein JO111_17405 [Caulobacteraceae bacterium]|nr:hypothetical protein [Caulobacteraceae bacterium]
MPLYTLRFFVQGDEPEGSEEIDCATDAEAINAVNDRADTRAIELWQADRMILWWPARRRLPTRRKGPRTPFMP